MFWFIIKHPTPYLRYSSSFHHVRPSQLRDFFFIDTNRAGVPGLDTVKAGVHGPYIADAYDSLPTLAAAEKAFRDLDVQSRLHGPIRDIFVAHGVQEVYGVALLHRHFAIEPTSRLVEHSGTSVPWEIGDETSTVCRKWGGVIKPRSLRLFGGDFRPYEFSYTRE